MLSVQEYSFVPSPGYYPWWGRRASKSCERFNFLSYSAGAGLREASSPTLKVPHTSTCTMPEEGSRSEEHTSELQSLAYLVCRLIISKEQTSELQSLAYLVCRLLLEKKQTRIRLAGADCHMSQQLTENTLRERLPVAQAAIELVRDHRRPGRTVYG